MRVKIVDRELSVAWLSKIVRNALYRHYDKWPREVQTVNLKDVNDRFVAANNKPAETTAFELLALDSLLRSP